MAQVYTQECDQSASGMFINPPIIFTIKRQRWSSTAFSSYLALLVWRSIIRVISHPTTSIVVTPTWCEHAAFLYTQITERTGWGRGERRGVPPLWLAVSRQGPQLIPRGRPKRYIYCIFIFTDVLYQLLEFFCLYLFTLTILCTSVIILCLVAHQ
jgi:hypothetical protein